MSLHNKITYIRWVASAGHAAVEWKRVSGVGHAWVAEAFLPPLRHFFCMGKKQKNYIFEILNELKFSMKIPISKCLMSDFPTLWKLEVPTLKINLMMKMKLSAILCSFYKNYVFIPVLTLRFLKQWFTYACNGIGG